MRIAIIGAGPGGLTAARILQQRGLAVTVFDADAGPDTRDQGGTLDLHWDGGRIAIRLAGLEDAFRARARFEDQGDRVVDHATAALLQDNRPDDLDARPEIDRRELRDLLVESLAPGTVTWGKKVASVVLGESHRIVFSDGESAAYDVVIGADGAWSRVRAALSDVKPAYTGVTFFELWIGDIDRRHPELSALLGCGSMFALHERAGIVAQRNGHGRARVYVALHVEDEWGAASVRSNGIAAMKRILSARLSGWSPRLRGFLDASEEYIACRPIYALPPTFAWEPRAGITLVGDAAHLMPPLGVGVNLAMQDAAELAIALSSADWRDAVRTHEAHMMARAHELAPQTARGFQELFGADGETSVLSHMASR